jgi:hypothetical protein
MNAMFMCGSRMDDRYRLSPRLLSTGLSAVELAKCVGRAAIPTTGLCRSLRNLTVGLIDQGASTRHSLAPSSIGRRAGMMQICHRLWTLAWEHEGPLVRYLDSFAGSLDSEGFKRLLIGRQIRIAADFSRWLQSQAIPVEAVSVGHVRQLLGSLTHRLVVRQGGAAALWRLVDLLRRRDICYVLARLRCPEPG